jgi:hypothetical protein
LKLLKRGRTAFGNGSKKSLQLFFKWDKLYIQGMKSSGSLFCAEYKAKVSRDQIGPEKIWTRAIPAIL